MIYIFEIRKDDQTKIFAICNLKETVFHAKHLTVVNLNVFYAPILFNCLSVISSTNDMTCLNQISKHWNPLYTNYFETCSSPQIKSNKPFQGYCTCGLCLNPKYRLNEILQLLMYRKLRFHFVA